MDILRVSEKLGAIPFPNNEFLNGNFAPPVYLCGRAKQEPKIDGDVFKPFWDDAPKTVAFRDIEGSCRPAPKFETWAKLLWDEDNLYIGAVLYGSEIWAYVSGRDDVVFFDNDFEFFLDKKGTTHEYFELESNALNTLWDLMLTKPYTDGGTPYDGFNYNGIESAVKICGELNNPNTENKYWSIEFKIPWKSIARYGSASDPPKTGDYYRFNFSRVHWQTEVIDGKYVKKINPETGNPFPEDNWVLAPTGVVNIHYPELWAFLCFVDDASNASFKIPEVEKIKWELRKLYYLQREYFEANGKFSKDIKIESKYEIKIETTTSLFQAYVEKDGLRISIIQDGYTWIEKI